MTNNPYREMASAMRARSGFDGNLLLFKKGLWTAGKDAIDMNDKQLVALVDDTMFGWTKWEDKRPVDDAIGRVADGFKPPKSGPSLREKMQSVKIDVGQDAPGGAVPDNRAQLAAAIVAAGKKRRNES